MPWEWGEGPSKKTKNGERRETVKARSHCIWWKGYLGLENGKCKSEQMYL